MLKLFKRRPKPAELVKLLISKIAGLELMNGEQRALPGIDGVWGTFRIKGNANPTIEYQVFDDALMEFVRVVVYLNLPDRITFEAVTDDLGSVVIHKNYEKPFWDLAEHLVRYFPLMADPDRNLSNVRA